LAADAVCLWALLLGATVQFIRGRVLKEIAEVEPKLFPTASHSSREGEGRILALYVRS
jgi:hypothetical protein